MKAIKRRMIERVTREQENLIKISINNGDGTYLVDDLTINVTYYCKSRSAVCKKVKRILEERFKGYC